MKRFLCRSNVPRPEWDPNATDGFLLWHRDESDELVRFAGPFYSPGAAIDWLTQHVSEFDLEVRV